MPYINRFKFEVRNISNDSELDLKYLENKCGNFSWHYQDENMIKYSFENPGKLFIIEKQGENKNDFSKSEYFNGEIVTGKVILTEQDAEIFYKAIENSPAPTETLKKAIDSYKEKFAA